MTDTTEHRGWEIESHYSQHILDDPDIDVADDVENGGGAFWGLLIAFALLFIATFAIDKWFSPPEVKFPPPIAIAGPNEVIDLSALLGTQVQGYSVSCLYVNGREHVIRPNYENPNCQAEFTRRSQR